MCETFQIRTVLHRFEEHGKPEGVNPDPWPSLFVQGIDARDLLHHVGDVLAGEVRRALALCLVLRDDVLAPFECVFTEAPSALGGDDDDLAEGRHRGDTRVSS